MLLSKVTQRFQQERQQKLSQGKFPNFLSIQVKTPPGGKNPKNLKGSKGAKLGFKGRSEFLGNFIFRWDFEVDEED